MGTTPFSTHGAESLAHATAAELQPGKGNAELAQPWRKIIFETHNVQPPSPLYLGTEDILFMQVFAPTIAVPFSLNFEIRWLDPTDGVKTIRRTIIVSATKVNQPYILGEGFLLSISASLVGAATAARGQVFCQAFIVRNLLTDPLVTWSLLSDYVSTNFHPTWPGGIYKSPLEGPGYLHVVNTAAPGAGSGFVIVVPAGVRWRLQSLVFSLTTAVAVANRNVNLLLSPDGSNTLYFVSALASQAASLSVIYSAAAISPYTEAQTNLAVLPLPLNYVLLAGASLTINAQNLQAADQFSQSFIDVEEWADV